MSPKGFISTVDMKSIKKEPSKDREQAPPVLNERKERGMNAGQEFTYHCPVRMKVNSNPSGNGLACMIQVSIEDCRTFPFFMLSLKYPRFGRYVLMLIITCTK